LACDTVCRNLPFMKCDLPRGLPQDVVDDIYNSLIRNRALNSTTLKAFRNCEVGTIEFSNCRGVTDEWLEHLSSSQNETDYDWKNQFTENKQPVICTNLSYPSVAIMQRDFVSSQKLDVTVDIDEQGVSTNKGESFSTAVDTQQQPADGKLQINENSSWSTSSFLSANSNQQECTHMALSIDSYDDTDQGMDDYVEKDKVKEDERRPSMDETELSDTSSNQKMPQSEISVVYTTEGFGHSTTESYFVSPNLTSIEPHFCATVNTKVLDLRGCQSLTDRGLILLTNLYNLEEAYFDDCHSLSGRGLSALSKSQNLHLVSLRNCRRLTDDGIIHLSQSNRFLETFILEGCRCLTDRSMFSISSCTNLGKLDLSQCDLISDDGLKQLKELRKLTYLNLGWCRKITDHGLDTLTSQPGRRDNLIELVLARCISISDIGIEYLTRLLNLERLYVNGCKAISSTVLGRTIQNLKKLTTLDASYMPGIL
jgi:Leucine Rich repeat